LKYLIGDIGNLKKPESVGHNLEQTVLIATHLLRGEGYSVSITEKVSELARKRVTLGAVYSSLDRLERKGLVKAWFVDPQLKRGAQSRRCFRVTEAGELALADARTAAQVVLNALGDFA